MRLIKVEKRTKNGEKTIIDYDGILWLNKKHIGG